MLWEVEVRPKGRDAERDRVAREYDLLAASGGRQAADCSPMVIGSARGFLLEGDIARGDADRLTRDLLVDWVVEDAGVSELGAGGRADAVTVLLKPGVTDPVAQSVIDAAADSGVELMAVRTFRRYFGRLAEPSAERDLLFRKVLANDAIEQVIVGPLSLEHLTVGRGYEFRRVEVMLCDLDDAGLMRVSRDGQLALSVGEMRAVRDHFRELGREPTDAELETVAQTWSEHCSHKTLKGPIDYAEVEGGERRTRRYANLLKETIFGATQEIRRRLGADDWCVSVFSDNAGVVRFDDDHDVCFKVETHNRPSAIEPYGGANTGIGGVIRDPLGTGLGARPVCNTDVFCFAPPDFPADELPPGVLHPRRVMHGVVAGVRDYGNRMGIPTVNGAVLFDPRYLGNPLVFCGTVGIMPRGQTDRPANAGDLIVAVGGRTGRDGIHGATFSSEGLTAESEKVSGGAVQIGNAITQKKLLDVILTARDRGLYSAITDCGAGGFSSAVGEMGEKIGAVVHLDRAPLKYEGLSYTEVWISESQERMVLAVPPAHWPELQALCASEGVEAAAIGDFEATGRLRLLWHNHEVGDLAMDFLHGGRPAVVREAVWEHRPPAPATSPEPSPDHAEPLRKILGSYTVCSKEWVIRQYDHEVQAGSAVKPLVGVRGDGPGDASVVMPVLGSWAGLAVGCGINPLYGDIDPYWMAAAAIDEAIRNVVAVGADPARVAILDNFCWGNVNDPATLGSLVRAAEGCRDAALAFGTPFISGKDSLNNEYRSGDRHITIPPTLLISALGRVADVRRCVTMDLKEPGNHVYVVGLTRGEMGGSHYHAVTGGRGGDVPRVDLQAAPAVFRALHDAIARGLVRACHDLSEGGLAVALAEMAFAGEVGVEVDDLAAIPGGDGLTDAARLFAESPTRFAVEVRPADAAAFEACLAGVPAARVGRTVAEQRLRLGGAIDADLAGLKEAWQRPLRW